MLTRLILLAPAGARPRRLWRGRQAPAGSAPSARQAQIPPWGLDLSAAATPR